MSARHADDQELCRQRTGMIIGKLCDACEGRCPICDSRSNPSKAVKICDSCAGAERFAVLENTSSSSTSTKTSDNNNNNNDTSFSSSSILQQDHPAFDNPQLVQTSVSRVLGRNLTQYVGQSNAAAQSRCVICSGIGKHVAYFCRACCLLEKDRDGCPKVKTVGARKAMERQKQIVRDRQQGQSKFAAADNNGFS